MIDGGESALASGGEFPYKPRMAAVKKTNRKLPQPEFDLAGYLASSTSAVNAALDHFLPPGLHRQTRHTIHRARCVTPLVRGRQADASCTFASRRRRLAAGGSGSRSHASRLRGRECIHTIP